MRLFRQRHPWGTEITGFGRPMGLGLDGEGRLLATDMDCHLLVRFDAALGHYQCHAGIGHRWEAPLAVADGRTPGRPARPPRGWNGPHAVVQDARGRLLVTCYYDPMVAVLEGGEGAGRVLIGKLALQGPATSRIDARGRLLVAEYALNLLLAFDADGAYLGRLGLDAARRPLEFDAGRGGVPASPLPGGFDRLHMALGAPDGSILVADTWNDRLQRFSAGGEFIGRLGGDIARPVALDLNARGQLLVTAWGSHEVLLLGNDGRRLPMARLPALEKPYDARFFGEGAVVADTHHGRILVVDNLHPPRIP